MSWTLTKLSDFLTERDGRIKHEEANQLGLQRIKKIDFSGTIHLDSETDTKTDMIRAQCGDLVISGINAAKGAIAVYEDENDVLATIHYSAYQFNPDRISVDFLKWFFKSSEFSDLLKEQIPGGIKTELKSKHILPLKVKLPELSEQITIADKLNRIRFEQLKLETENAHQESLLVKLKQAILQEAIQGKLTADWRAANPDTEPAAELLKRIQKEKARLIANKKLRKENPIPPITPAEIPFEIPASWEWCRLGDISEHCLGKMLDKGKNEGVNTPYLRNLNVRWYQVDRSDLKLLKLQKHEIETLSVIKGDVLICEGGGGIGRTAVWEHEDKIVFQKALHRVRFLGNFYVPLLFNHYMRLTSWSGCIEKFFTGAGIPHLTGKSIHIMPIPLPPLAEQSAIVERVEALMAHCRELETEIEHSRTHAVHLLQSVLKEAFAPSRA